MTEERKISGSNNSDNPVNVHLTGGRYFFIAMAACMIGAGTFYIWAQLYKSNELKARELEIQTQQLELAKKQYTLDSLQYFAPNKTR